MTETINGLSSWWWAWVAPMVWQVTLLAAVVGGLDLVLHKRGWPQVRHALWALVFVKLILPPTFSLPSSLSAPLISAGGERTAVFAPAEYGPVVETPLAPPDAPFPSVPGNAVRETLPGEVVSAERARLSPHAWLAILSGVGTFALFSWLILRLRRLRRIAAEDGIRHDVSETVTRLLAGCAERLRLRRPPHVVMTDRIPSAGVFGVLRPTLLLPCECATLPRKQLEHIFLHELAHIKRGDLAMNAAQTVLTMLFWFHPVLWFAGRRLRQLREICCDARVATLLREQTPAYAATLVDAADRIASTRGESVLGLLGLFENSSRLRQRLTHLKCSAWKHSRLRIITAFAAAAMMLACVVPMAAVKAAPQPEPAPAPADKAVLRGVVKRADNGEPLAGVTIELFDFHAGPDVKVASAKSGPDGRFELVSDRHGKFYMTARADGWFSQFDKMPYRETQLTVGEVAKDIEIPMIASGIFTGSIMEKGTGKPLEDALVRINSGMLSTETDAQGKFRFTGLPVALELRVSATAPGYGIAAFSVSVPAGEIVERTITLDQQAVFVGRVLDANGKPIQGAEVHCSTDNRGSREHWTVKTGRKGWYQIQRVNRGAYYRVGASKHGYIGQSHQVRVAPDAGIVKVNFTFKSGLSASGKVIDGDGKPVAGVTVHWGRGYDHRVKTTGPDGRFAFEGLKSEHPNEVYAVKPGYAMGTVRVDPKDPGKANNVVVELKPELTISGVVLDTKGKPVPNASLMIGRQSPVLQKTQADGQGRFTMRTLEDRSYKITVMSRKPLTIQESEPIKAGTTDARIVLREFGCIAGRVVDDATGEPIRSFNVRMAFTKTGRRAYGFGVRLRQQGVNFSHKDGRFKLTGDYFDPENAYRLIVNANGYEWCEVDDVHAGTPVEVRLKKASPVTVQVTDAATGKVVTDATVRFHYFYRGDVPMDGHSISSRNLSNCALTPIEAKTLGRGRYGFLGVGAGPWILEVTTKDYVRYAKAFRDGVKGNTVDVKLEGARTITGILKPPQGMRPEQFKISFEAGGNRIEAQSDSQGRFKLEQSPPEKGSISVRTQDNNLGANWPLDLRSLPEQKLVLDFSEFFVLTGRVTVADENASNARLNAGCHRGADWATAWAKSGPDGRYRLFLPQKGKYSVSASSAAGKVKLDIKIDRKTTSRDLELITGAISGVLLDKDGAPIKWASVIHCAATWREHTCLLPRTLARRTVRGLCPCGIRADRPAREVQHRRPYAWPIQDCGRQS